MYTIRETWFYINNTGKKVVKQNYVLNNAKDKIIALLLYKDILRDYKRSFIAYKEKENTCTFFGPGQIINIRLTNKI